MNAAIYASPEYDLGTDPGNQIHNVRKSSVPYLLIGPRAYVFPSEFTHVQRINGRVIHVTGEAFVLDHEIWRVQNVRTDACLNEQDECRVKRTFVEYLAAIMDMRVPDWRDVVK